MSNLKYKTSNGKKEKDELCAVLAKSQDDEVPFVRQLQLAPEPACILANNRQINDTVKFCSAESMTPSIVGIDTTFNIGSYYVTPTTYKHAMLKNRNGDGHPTFLGPTLVHCRRNDDFFRYFASMLVALYPEIANILYMGSDREAAVRNISILFSLLSL